MLGGVLGCYIQGGVTFKGVIIIQCLWYFNILIHLHKTTIVPVSWKKSSAVCILLLLVNLSSSSSSSSSPPPSSSSVSPPRPLCLARSRTLSRATIYEKERWLMSMHASIIINALKCTGNCCTCDEPCMFNFCLY